MTAKNTGKVRCRVCGEIIDASSEVCPICGMGPEHFEPIDEAPAQVKCLICGEVFDASLTSCPVCAVGPENFVPVTAEPEQTFRRDTNEIFTVLGGGVAALSAAKAIRARNETATIVLVSEEEVLPYNRPMLTKNLSREGLDTDLSIQPESWYEENRIYPMLGQRAAKLDLTAREITLESGMKLAYDKLVYALGARCFVPPIEGANLGGVYTIRSIGDAQTVHAKAASGSKAVVIGGGVLGLETAWELKKSGLEVTVVESMPRLLAGKLDEEASSLLTRIAEAAGVSIISNAKIARIEGESEVSAVLLADGTRIPADFVVVSCGIRANSALAEAAGLRTNRAVVVNANMQTSASRVWAAGDCAEYDGLNYGVWAEASQQGEIAGANAAGDELTYRPEAPALTMNALGTSLYAVGDIARADETDSHVKGQKMKKLFYSEGRLVGAILIGDLSRMRDVSDAIARGAMRGDDL